MKKCCDSNKNDKICIRSDGKTFKLPRRFPKLRKLEVFLCVVRVLLIKNV